MAQGTALEHLVVTCEVTFGYGLLVRQSGSSAHPLWMRKLPAYSNQLYSAVSDAMRVPRRTPYERGEFPPVRVGR